MELFKKILIANRGEIAVRVIRAAKGLGIQTVAVYSQADAQAFHVRMADESYALGDNDLANTYLNIEKIIQLAKSAGCEAIHPGYGFLAENPLFVEACDRAGIVFIGPSARAIRLMGNKIESRAFVKKLGIAMTEGITGDIDTLKRRAGKLTLPVLVKAAAGGGGKGMRIVYDMNELDEVLESTSREAKSYFGDGTVYIEKYIEEPRHIEIQVLGDMHGNMLHLFERECSIQRRYQKIVEESPSVTLNQEIRTKMSEAAVKIAREIGYSNAGTVEFLVNKDLDFYFLEMNTRIQVEHPVTEMVTGIDIVREQILIASGKEIEFKQKDIKQKGHAIECRIYAEDPENGFLPSPGNILLYSESSGQRIRVDSGFDWAAAVESFYDPLICKLISFGNTREQSRKRMMEALDMFIIHGIKTNIAFLKYLLASKAYKHNQISTKYCDDHLNDILKDISKDRENVPKYLPAIAYFLFRLSQTDNKKSDPSVNLWQKIGYWRSIMEPKLNTDQQFQRISISSMQNNTSHFVAGDKKLSVSIKEVDSKSITLSCNASEDRFHVSIESPGKSYVSCRGFVYHVSRDDVLSDREEVGITSGTESDQGIISSPMPGKVIKVNVKEGEYVSTGITLAVVEAMKMENYIQAPFDGVIKKVGIKEGDMVDGGEVLLVLK